MLPRAVVACLLLALLAGCTGGGKAHAKDDTPALQATATTGVIRAVVVDDAIRPLGGVNVTARGASATFNRTTGADGFVGFEGLPPGTYFLKASKRGYSEVQQSVEVVAGVGDSPVVKMQLAVRIGDLAFYQEFKLEGFLECSASVGNWCFIANYYPCLVEHTAGQACTGNLTNDNSYFAIDKPLLDLQRIPDWMQIEMVWESTQAAGQDLEMRADFLKAGNVTIDSSKTVLGPSPLLLLVNQTLLQKNGIGTTHSLGIETFHGGPDQLCSQTSDCLLAGAAVQQRFTDFLHIFYGYTPPDGWRFSTDGTVPQPP